MTPKQKVLAKYPEANLGSCLRRCCYVIFADKSQTKELGVSHGGKGRAWTNAAAILED